MTTATLNLHTLEELVDRLLAALFRDEPEWANAASRLTRTVHEPGGCDKRATWTGL